MHKMRLHPVLWIAGLALAAEALLQRIVDIESPTEGECPARL